MQLLLASDLHCDLNGRDIGRKADATTIINAGPRGRVFTLQETA